MIILEITTSGFEKNYNLINLPTIPDNGKVKTGFPRQDCVEAQIWGRVPKKMSAALMVPKNTVASIILKWKKFVTTKTTPRAGRLDKLSNRGRRALVREVTKNTTEATPQ